MAEIETLRQTIAQQNVISPVGAEVMREAQGRHGNEAVMRSDEASKLTDAAEELGMSVSHRMDKKSLGDRAVRQGQGTNLDAIARLSEYMDKLPNMPREQELKQLVEKLQQFQNQLEGRGGGGGGSGGAMPTKADIMAALQQFDGDVTHQFAALDVARQYFEARGTGAAFHALLAEAMAEFERTDVARDVRAGFASAEVAARAAATLETDPAKVREAYREMLRQDQNMGKLFDQLSKFDLRKNFAEVMQTFLTAAGRDLSSTGPSTDARFLHALLTELAKLKKLQTAFESANELVETTKPRWKPCASQELDGVGLTGRFLNFVSKSVVNIGDARNMLEGLEPCAAASKLVFANGLSNLHREIHDDAMPSMQARQQQTSTIGLLLDELVAAEEAEYQEATAAANQRSPSPAK